MLPGTPSIVVFDLGGVLARICHTWQDAVTVAQVPSRLDPLQHTRLTDFAGFEEYQADAISSDQYFSELARFLGCDPDEAALVHNGIIQSEYRNVGELIDRIEQAGFRTGCLSNTNGPHWQHLAIDGSFASIRRLECKMASHVVGLNKPDPRIFEAYENTFALAPSQIVYFDDHGPNADAARARGWRAHQIDPSEETVPQIERFLAEEGVFPRGVLA
jgi:putative hydrolase of the HAD superfamily